MPACTHFIFKREGIHIQPVRPPAHVFNCSGSNRTQTVGLAGGGLVGVELQAKDFTATARLSLTRSSQYAISCLVEEFKGFLCFAGLGRNLANSSNNWLCLSRIDPGYFLHWPEDLCRTPLDEKEVIQELLSRSRVLCESVQREG